MEGARGMIAGTFLFFGHLLAMGGMMWAFLRAIAPMCLAPRDMPRGDGCVDPLDHRAGTALEGLRRL